jgi:hypothetical protein
LPAEPIRGYTKGTLKTLWAFKEETHEEKTNVCFITQELEKFIRPPEQRNKFYTVHKAIGIKCRICKLQWI